MTDDVKHKITAPTGMVRMQCTRIYPASAHAFILPHRKQKPGRIGSDRWHGVIGSRAGPGERIGARVEVSSPSCALVCWGDIWRGVLGFKARAASARLLVSKGSREIRASEQRAGWGEGGNSRLPRAGCHLLDGRRLSRRGIRGLEHSAALPSSLFVLEYVYKMNPSLNKSRLIRPQCAPGCPVESRPRRPPGAACAEKGRGGNGGSGEAGRTVGSRTTELRLRTRACPDPVS